MTTYTTAELSSPVTDDLFGFEPPADARLVAKFSDPLTVKKT